MLSLQVLRDVNRQNQHVDISLAPEGFFAGFLAELCGAVRCCAGQGPHENPGTAGQETAECDRPKPMFVERP
jgi:hypothetical protein